jgi:hypothetical protein
MFSPLDFGGSVTILELIHPETLDYICIGFKERREFKSLAIWDEKETRFFSQRKETRFFSQRRGSAPLRKMNSSRDSKILDLMIELFPYAGTREELLQD